MNIIRKLSLSLFIIFILFGCTEAITTVTESTEIEITTTTEIQSTTNTHTTTTEIISELIDLEIHYIDVGQADCILLKLPNNKNMLIDAGNNSDGDLVVDYLIEQGVASLDYVVGTHPHEDHIGGLDVVINNFYINNLFLPNIIASTKTYEDVLLAIESNDLTVTEAKAGVVLFDEKLNDKSLIGVMLSPISDTYSETNDYSPIIKLTYGETSYIFTGDAEIEVEEEVLESGVNIKADVLKLGHHGSNSSTSEGFLNAVSPSIGIISVGEDNNYGHPNQEIIDRLVSRGIQIYRTDLAGTIVIKSNGIDIFIETSKTNPNNLNEKKIVINEILPDPDTIYNEEWVELHNLTEQNIDIGGYSIDDIEGGSNPYIIPQGTIIEAGGFYTYYCPNPVFNNSGDEVRLINREGILIDSFKYNNSLNDHSWYRENDGSYKLTNNPTPNYAN